jgi:hypothetical protein
MKPLAGAQVRWHETRVPNPGGISALVDRCYLPELLPASLPGARGCNPIGVRGSGVQTGVWLRKIAGYVIPAKAGIYRDAIL